MTTPIESDGYEDLREYIRNEWTFVAVVDDGGTEILRWEVPAHASTQVLSGPSTNPLTYELTITGQDIQDAGNSLPVTLAHTESFPTSGATTRHGYDTFPNVEMQVPNDEVVITHRHRLPP